MLKKRVFIPLALIILLLLAWVGYTKANINSSQTRGDIVDSLNGVVVYYNGGINQTSGRNLAPDGYNLGIRWQCVEFVKRYYYEALGHKMPDTWGNAKDFFDPALSDGALNKQRNLIQFKNGGKTRPEVNDLIVFAGHIGNPYGHVAIVSAVAEGEIEIVQQNAGPFAPPRVRYDINYNRKGWTVLKSGTLGWLRLP